MFNFNNLVISYHNIEPVTDIRSQLPYRDVFTLFVSGCYAASGVTASGDLLEMWIVEFSDPALPTWHRSTVVLALNGLSNCRQYALDGDTRSLADWLRGRSFGCVAPQPSVRRRLLPGGRRLLAGLFADIAANESEAV